MSEAQTRWWYCPSCYAVCDGEADHSRCWNCERVQRKSRNFPFLEVRKKYCSVCPETYLVFGYPADTYLKGEEYEIGFCRRYFEHYGQNAYYPPMLPLAYLLELNGWEYNERTKKVVKAKKTS